MRRACTARCSGWPICCRLCAAAPVLCPGVTHDDLDKIADGTTASMAFWLMASGRADAETSTRLRRSLRTYCHRGTWAMVQLHRLSTCWRRVHIEPIAARTMPDSNCPCALGIPIFGRLSTFSQQFYSQFFGAWTFENPRVGCTNSAPPRHRVVGPSVRSSRPVTRIWAN